MVGSRPGTGNAELPGKKRRRAGMIPALLGDEVYTPSPQALRRAVRSTWRALFAPHCEQNLYANPKRTAKFISPLPQIRQHPHLFKKYFRATVIFFAHHQLMPSPVKSSAQNASRQNYLSFNGDNSPQSGNTQQ